jgi:3-oxoacyl-[acyl-carrier-protein] synthase-3
LAFLQLRSNENAAIDQRLLTTSSLPNFWRCKIRYYSIGYDSSCYTRQNKLQIKKPKCVAYDILLVVRVGLKVYFKPMLSSNQEWQNDVLWVRLSRVSMHMIFHDLLMAQVLPSSKLQRMKLECYPTKVQLTLSTKHTICFGKSYNSDLDPDTRYIKMYGRKNI